MQALQSKSAKKVGVGKQKVECLKQTLVAEIVEENRVGSKKVK